MGLNIRDAEDIFLAAKAEAEEIVDEVIEEFYKPLNDLSLAMVWAQTPEEVKNKLREMDPDAVAAIESGGY